jgi:hypothetical protein
MRAGRTLAITCSWLQKRAVDFTPFPITGGLAARAIVIVSKPETIYGRPRPGAKFDGALQPHRAAK